MYVDPIKNSMQILTPFDPPSPLTKSEKLPGSYISRPLDNPNLLSQEVEFRSTKNTLT